MLRVKRDCRVDVIYDVADAYCSHAHLSFDGDLAHARLCRLTFRSAARRLWRVRCNGRLGVPVHCRNASSQVTTSSTAAVGTVKWSAATVTNLLLAWAGALSKM